MGRLLMRQSQIALSRSALLLTTRGLWTPTPVRPRAFTTACRIAEPARGHALVQEITSLTGEGRATDPTWGPATSVESYRGEIEVDRFGDPWRSAAAAGVLAVAQRGASALWGVVPARGARPAGLSLRATARRAAPRNGEARRVCPATRPPGQPPHRRTTGPPRRGGWRGGWPGDQRVGQSAPAARRLARCPASRADRPTDSPTARPTPYLTHATLPTNTRTHIPRYQTRCPIPPPTAHPGCPTWAATSPTARPTLPASSPAAGPTAWCDGPTPCLTRATQPTNRPTARPWYQTPCPMPPPTVPPCSRGGRPRARRHARHSRPAARRRDRPPGAGD